MDHQPLEVVGMEVLDDLIVQFSTLLDTTIEERSHVCYVLLQVRQNAQAIIPERQVHLPETCPFST